MDAMFRLTVRLANGSELVETLDEADVTSLLDRKRNRYRIDEAWNPREAARRMIYTELAYLIREGTGHFGLYDKDRRHWLVPINSILAIALEDLDEQTAGSAEDWMLRRLDEGF